MPKGKKHTVQVSVWSNNADAVADFVNAVRLAAQAAFGRNGQEVMFGPGVGVQQARNSLNAVEWKSFNVSGRMRARKKP
jgi:hypothetical protein